MKANLSLIAESYTSSLTWVKPLGCADVCALVIGWVMGPNLAKLSPDATCDADRISRLTKLNKDNMISLIVLSLF